MSENGIFGFPRLVLPSSPPKLSRSSQMVVMQIGATFVCGGVVDVAASVFWLDCDLVGLGSPGLGPCCLKLCFSLLVTVYIVI